MGIYFLDDRFVLETENTSYVIVLKEETYAGTTEQVTTLCNAYWGEKLLRPEEIPTDYRCSGGSVGYLERGFDAQEYPAYGGKFFENECLKATLHDGVRDLRLSYASHVIAEDRNTLTVTLRDLVYPIEVDLHYKLCEGLDLIDRSTTVRNTGNEKIRLETMYSANWTCPYEKELTLTYLSSGWSEEFRVTKQPLAQGTVLLESRAGVSNATALPYFAVDKQADEHHGAVWFGTLQYCGNWQIKATRDRNGLPQIAGGISDFNTVLTLEAGRAFSTPVFTGGFVSNGFGEAKRQLHDYVRKNGKSHWTNKVMPVLYNAWATFEFNLNEELLLAQAERASKLGVEMFLIDDGWFKNRNDEKTGLGDWEVDAKKFPHGLTPIINKVNELGMIFGLWVEPEMVSEDSELYKNHPDWIFRYPTRQPVKKRHQYVLNLGREDVYRYTEGWLDRLLTKNNIGHLKWDMNRFLSEVNWDCETNRPDEEAYLNYTKNLYRLLEHLHQKFPHVLIENCASGGLRADLSMSAWCARINRSDNQDCLDVLKLHEGFTYVNPTKMAGGGANLHHIGTISPSRRKEPMKRMAYTAMMGSLSIGYDLRRLSEEETAELTTYVKLHKELRETVQLGDMYLLRSVYEPNTPAVVYQFVSKDKQKSVVFVYSNNQGFMGWLDALKLRGLEPEKQYHISLKGVERINIELPPASGDTLMKMGLSFRGKRMLTEDSVYGCFAIVLE